MKYIIILISVVFSSLTVHAQDKDIKTEKLLVSGNCEMCEKRIEKAAYVKGVKRAEWDKDKHELTVTYKPSKTSKEEILKSVAEAGYDSEAFTASEDAYEKLPECCHYRTATCNH
ncbi:MAG: heavy-metal-associated domain-containing protein [Chitinophagales bacterium]|nr:heavy-metal-associated domain-containing protein [Chitinophagales bacterium]